jgi:hypothetical protein
MTPLEQAAAELIERAKNKKMIPTQCKEVRAWLKAYAAAKTDEERWTLI